MRAAFLLCLASTLAGCGNRDALSLPEGRSPPPVPVMADAPPTPEELLEPAETARPERVDDLLKRSEERAPDRFDLPPPGMPPGAVPVPGEDDAGAIEAEEDGDRPEPERS
ncbi:MAG: hypothetical protein ACFBQW_09925 [Sphingomonadaceae bacterium]